MDTTGSKQGVAVSVNVRNRQFEQTQPNQAWIFDITYVRIRSGWLYLTELLNLHSRKLVRDVERLKITITNSVRIRSLCKLVKC